MKLVFNPSGTHIKDGSIKVRFDLYPEIGDKTNALCSVNRYDRVPTAEELADVTGDTLKLIPKHLEVNPCLCIFVTIDDDTTVEELGKYLNTVLDKDTIATLDTVLLNEDSGHYVQSLMKDKLHINKKRTSLLNKSYINSKFDALAPPLQKGGQASIVSPESIDIGDTAIDRTSYIAAGATYFSLSNSANATGALTTFEVWADVNQDYNGVVAGTAYLVSGTTYHVRDAVTLGNVPAGTKVTFTGLSCSVVTGDVLAHYAVSGYLDRDNTGAGVRRIIGSHVTPGYEGDASVIFSGYAISIYGTGIEYVAPTTTTQAATSVTNSSCVGNGNITATGGQNATRRGFCYVAGTSGDPTTADSVVYDGGSFGTGAFTKSITGLAEGTGYRVRAYAVNSAGTGYGDTVQVTTLSTTMTFYPDAHPETTSVDGYVVRIAGQDTWANTKAGAGTNAGNADANSAMAAFYCGTTTNKFTRADRTIFLFDTSLLPNGATITSAIFSIYGAGAKQDPTSSSPTFNIYSSNPASNTALVPADFTTLGTTQYATSITYAAWNDSGYNDFTLNAAGIAAISKTGITKFGLREASFDAGSGTPNWVNSAVMYVGGCFSEAGAGYKPKLVITYIPSGNAKTRFSTIANGYKDAVSRFKVSTSSIKDIATRYKITSQNFKNAATRFVAIARNYKDAATRYLAIVRNYKDAATRYVVNSRSFKDIATRFTSIVKNYKDAATRYLLSIRNYQDVASRFNVRLGISALKDAAARFRSIAVSVNDAASRYLLFVQNYADAAARIKVFIRDFADAAVRFSIVAESFADVSTRFSLCGQSLKDIATRFKLTASAYKDIATRFSTVWRGVHNASTRFIVILQPFSDAAARFKVTIESFYNIITRYSVGALSFQDIATRIKLSVPYFFDAPCRFKVASGLLSPPTAIKLYRHSLMIRMIDHYFTVRMQTTY